MHHIRSDQCIQFADPAHLQHLGDGVFPQFVRQRYDLSNGNVSSPGTAATPKIGCRVRRRSICSVVHPTVPGAIVQEGGIVQPQTILVSVVLSIFSIDLGAQPVVVQVIVGKSQQWLLIQSRLRVIAELFQLCNIQMHHICGDQRIQFPDPAHLQRSGKPILPQLVHQINDLLDRTHKALPSSKPQGKTPGALCVCIRSSGWSGRYRLRCHPGRRSGSR